MELIAVYYIIINFVALIAYGADKFFAKKKMRRVPEKRLLWLAFMGGAFGAACGMYFFRHKTKHMNFKILVPLAAVIHAAVIIALLWGKSIMAFFMR